MFGQDASNQEVPGARGGRIASRSQLLYHLSVEASEDFERELSNELRATLANERRLRELRRVLGEIDEGLNSYLLSEKFLLGLLSDLEGVSRDLSTEVAVFAGRQAAAERYTIRQRRKTATEG